MKTTLQKQTGGGGSKDTKMNKERKSNKKNIFNPLNKPLTKKTLILFVGNWLLKALLKPLVSVGRRWGLLWSC